MLNRVKNLFKRLREKLRHLNSVIKYVKKQNSKCYIVILFDFIWCYIVYFMDLEEYKKYELYNINHDLRKTYLNDVYHDLMRPFIFKKENIVITKQLKITKTSLISNLQPPTFLREKTKEKGLLYLPLVKATLV